MMLQNSHKMFGFSILKLIISYIKPHYRYGLLHRLVTKIIMTNSRIQLKQNRSPSSGLLLEYIANCLYFSLTPTRVNSVNATDTKETSETI